MDTQTVSANTNALNQLIKDEQFQKLIERTQRLNIFEAVGLRRQELRHSDFLAFMLDPSSNHGMGDVFLREFIRQAKLSLSTQNLSEARVYREHFFIDLLIEVPREWVLLIENKIDAAESENQLATYRERAQQAFHPLQPHMLFLTPTGLQARAGNEDWTSISYKVIYDTCSRLLHDKSIAHNPKVKMLLEDYATFLGSHILNNPELKELCKQLYREHRLAIDLLLEHLPKLKNEGIEIAQQITLELQKEHDIELDDAYHHKLQRIADTTLDHVAEITDEQLWTESRRGLLYEWEFDDNALYLDFVIGPIDEQTKQNLVSSLSNQFPRTHQNSGKYIHIYREKIIAFDDILETDNPDNLVTIGKTRVLDFIKRQRSVLGSFL